MRIGRRELLAGGVALGVAGRADAAVSTLPDVEAPFKMDGGRPWTGVWIDKQGPFRFGISTGVSVTMLARGVPVGGELDWLDDGTIAQAMRARRPA